MCYTCVLLVHFYMQLDTILTATQTAACRWWSKSVMVELQGLKAISRLVVSCGHITYRLFSYLVTVLSCHKFFYGTCKYIYISPVAYVYNILCCVFFVKCVFISTPLIRKLSLDKIVNWQSIYIYKALCKT